MFVPTSTYPPSIYPGTLPSDTYPGTSCPPPQLTPPTLHLSNQVATPQVPTQVLHLPRLLPWLAGGDASSNCCSTFVTGQCHDFHGHPPARHLFHDMKMLKQVDSAPAVHIDDVYITGILRQVDFLSMKRKNH